MSNMDTLRSGIFDAINDLRAKRIDVSTANALAGLSQTMINTLKVELEARRLVGAKTLPSFISQKPEPQEELTPEEREVAGKELMELVPPPGSLPIVGVTRHYMPRGHDE